ncbi:MAG: CBS domain-containing protein [Chloroflexi bacterium]|nr:CBS domain-containing protein [Chloroflexota bacterium]
MPKRSDIAPREPLDQPIHEVMRTEVISVSPDTPTHEIVALLLQKGYRSLPVVAENGRLLGIITDGDLLRRVGVSTRLNGATTDWQEQFAALSQQAATGASLMTAPVITINPTDSLHQAVQKMTSHHLKRLPVVAEDGYLVGWISRVDILRLLDRERPLSKSPAEEVRTSCRPTAQRPNCGYDVSRCAHCFTTSQTGKKLYRR